MEEQLADIANRRRSSAHEVNVGRQLTAVILDPGTCRKLQFCDVWKSFEAVKRRTSQTGSPIPYSVRYNTVLGNVDNCGKTTAAVAGRAKP